MSKNPGELCDICELLPNIPPAMVIAEDYSWTANLATEDQSCLGRSYLTLKRHASELDQLTGLEEVSFRIIRNCLIRAIRQEFSPVTFNISCLKNGAFRDDPDTTPSSAAHVHWHVVPRYGTQPISFAGEEFTDPDPGRYLPAVRDRKAVNEDVAAQIVQTIRLGYTPGL